MEVESKLVDLLKQRRLIDLEIARVIGESNLGSIRFSEKKFVGDLGEYYFFKFCPPFLEIEQCETSNKYFDFQGRLSEEARELFELEDTQVRIEVKTRHAQIGNNHLFAIDNTKFDLLAFVALADDFSCRYIGMISGRDIVVDRQNRIRYSDYHKRGLVKWETAGWTEL